MTAALKQLSPNALVTSLVMTICTFIICRYVGSVGDRVDTTHDATTRLIVKQETIEKNVVDIKAVMMTRSDLAVELLKLQKADRK